MLIQSTFGGEIMTNKTRKRIKVATIIGATIAMMRLHTIVPAQEGVMRGAIFLIYVISVIAILQYNEV